MSTLQQKTELLRLFHYLIFFSDFGNVVHVFAVTMTYAINWSMVPFYALKNLYKG